MPVAIFANGDIREKEWLEGYLDDADFIIAADGGARHLAGVGRRPDLVIGDLDSMPAELRSGLAEKGTKFIDYPQEKDETDLELALLYAAKHFQGAINVFGALGGRLDQTLANIMLLTHPGLRESHVKLVEAYQEAWLIEKDWRIEGSKGDQISFIPFDNEVIVEKTSGLKWPLHDEILEFGLTRGISNIMTGEFAGISLRKGRLLCVHTRLAWDR